MISGEINPTVHTTVLAALELAANKALKLAPQSASQLAILEDQVFELQCSAPQFSVFLAPHADGIRLIGVYEGIVTTAVRGVASDFAQLATSEDPAACLINGNLEIEGDSAPLLELQKILAGLDIDWEAPLVDALGDVAGHQLASMLRGAFRWGHQASNSFVRQLEEFIHEEGRFSPPKLELEDFYRDIQALSLRTERLQSRTQRLQKRLNARQS